MDKRDGLWVRYTVNKKGGVLSKKVLDLFTHFLEDENVIIEDRKNLEKVLKREKNKCQLKKI